MFFEDRVQDVDEIKAAEGALEKPAKNYPPVKKLAVIGCIELLTNLSKYHSAHAHLVGDDHGKGPIHNPFNDGVVNRTFSRLI